MEEKYIEESVKELIEDLKEKVDALTQNAQDDDESIAEKAQAIKNKAVRVFNDASEKLKGMMEDTVNDEEVSKVIETVKARSKDLYENALDKISALKAEKAVQQEPAQPKEETDESKDILAEAKNGIDQIISNVGEEINNFVNREDVKTAVEKTKEGVVDAAEKALEILKGWLAPEREDK